MKHMYCANPYILAEIMPYGNVYPCSCNWIDNYTFGNIFEQSYEEIWNGQKAQDFRQKIYENDLRFCPGCKHLEILQETTEEQKSFISPPPERILLGLDEFCDVRCIFCRDENRLDKDILPDGVNLMELLRPWLEKAKYVKTNAVGEVFASKKSRDLLKDIADNFPNLKFEIITNGILCTPRNLEKLNLTNRISMMTISLHACTKKTYDKIVKKGNFEKVMENIKHISQMKKNGEIERFEIHFTITSLNYKEMAKMIDFCKEIDAQVRFLGLDCSENLEEIFKKINIENKTHPKYNDFVKTVQTDKFKNSKDTVLQGIDYLLSLEKISLVDKIKNKFKHGQKKII